MKWIPFSLLVLVGALLDAGNLLNFISFHDGQIQPQILLVLLVFFSMDPKPDHAIIASFAIGLAADISGSVIGPYMVCFGLAGSLLAQTREILNLRHPLHQAGVVFITALAVNLLAAWLSSIKLGHTSGLATGDLLGRVLYTTIVAPMLWPLLQSLSRYIHKPEPSRSRSITSLHV